MQVGFSTLKILATVKHYCFYNILRGCFSTLKILATVKQKSSKFMEKNSFSTLKILATVKLTAIIGGTGSGF